MGLFHAYISTAENIQVEREPSMKAKNETFHPDFLIILDNTPILIEFNRNGKSDDLVSSVENFMKATKTFNGIMFLSNFIKPEPEIEIKEFTKTIDEELYQIVLISA